MSTEKSKNVRLNLNRFGQDCQARGATITTLQLKLTELNQQFPDERLKPFKDRSPDYVLQRSQVTETLNLLTVRQKETRKNIRELI